MMKMSFGLCLLVSALVAAVSSESVRDNVVTQDARPVKRSLRDFLPCVKSLNVRCFFDTADDYLKYRIEGVIAEANARAFQITGRAADTDHPPSALAETITKMIEELSGMLQEGLSSFFRSGKESEDGDEIEESSAEETEGDQDKDASKSRALVEEARKKKKHKIHKLIAAIKALVVGGVLKVLFGCVLKIFMAHLQVKFLLIALGGLALNAARFWIDLKKKHAPEKVIYYENAQHQHHYETDGEEYGHDHGHSGPGEGYWGRAYEVPEGQKTAQDMAYASQKPVGTGYSKVDNKPNFSWLG
ncbi:unnamed protein product [Brassicogethes aeneus]|uniref:Osiris 9 n=1 Tax=Brassicogethes aeneus TaxID=1431903 RepID=A0A9P0AZA5_BRAAE|nr:unnamed protein product [Brassicogethes aeneus]